MSATGNEGISVGALQQIVERAGMDLDQEELEQLKPLYDLYWQYVTQLHSIDLQAEEIAMAFHPEWPS